MYEKCIPLEGRHAYAQDQYRLNGETEHHDPVEPSTACCPLLPGQPVNVLEVPTEPKKSGGLNDSSDSIDSMVFTLDPKDKYLPPGVRRAATTSAIDQGKVRLRKEIEKPQSPSKTIFGMSKGLSQVPNSTSEDLTLERARSIRSVFQKMRRTKSAGTGIKPSSSWHRKVFSRSGSSHKAAPTEDVPAVPKIPEAVFGMSGKVDASTARLGCMENGGYNERQNMPSATLDRQISSSVYTSRESSGHASIIDPSHESSRAISGIAHRSWSPKSEKIATRKTEEESGYIESMPISRPASSHSNQPDHHKPRFSSGISCEAETAIETRTPDFVSNYSESRLSYATDNNFSPGPASTAASGPTSPRHLSQPDTPAINEFDADKPGEKTLIADLDLGLLSIRPPSQAPPPPPPLFTQESPISEPQRTFHPVLSGFQGYSLPENEHASALTICKTPSTPFSHRSEHSSDQGCGKQELVQSWNDGSGHQMTALEEMMGDLGYLGELII